MGTHYTQQNFTGGEFSPTLGARFDIDKYRTAVRKMQNFLPNLHGDVARRPGTHFIAELGGICALIPFSFSVEEDQNYVLIFSHEKMRVSDGHSLLDVEEATPYAASDLYDLSYAQVGDVVYIAHPKYPLAKILRFGSAGHYLWSWQLVALNSSLRAPAAPTCTFKGEGGDFTLRYKVVAVDKDGKESLPSSAGECQGKHPSDWVVGNHVILTWGSVQGAAEYNIYREEAGYYGFIGTCKADDLTRQCTGVQWGNTQSKGLLHMYGKWRNPAENVSEPGRAVIDLTEDSGQVAFEMPPDGSHVQKLVMVYDSKGGDRWLLVRESHGPHYVEAYGPMGTNRQYPQGTMGGLPVNPIFTGYQLTFDDQNYEPDIADTPREDWNPFVEGNNPATVTFHQQRMVLGGTRRTPQTFYMSRTGDFENFRKSRPLQDDDPIEYSLASGSIDGIQWVASFGDLLLGTSGGEYKATGESGIITTKNVSISSQSFWGSAGLAPLIIGNSVLHVQRHGARVRDLYYSLEKDGYAGNDLSIMAPHLFEGHSIKQWAYQQTPGSRVWLVRDDGVLLCLTYLKEQDIYGWSRHVTQGKVRSVCVLSGQSSDVVFAVVERDGHFFLERLADVWGPQDDIREAFFVDCGVTVRRSAASTEVTGLGHLERKKVAVLADGSPVEGLVVHGGGITLPYPCKVVQVGLPYTSELELLPVEANLETGSTLGKVRGYAGVNVWLYRSVGGSVAASKDGPFYDLPFLPSIYGDPCEPYTGDYDMTLTGAQAPHTTVIIDQRRPLPMHIISVTSDIDFGEN